MSENGETPWKSGRRTWLHEAISSAIAWTTIHRRIRRSGHGWCVGIRGVPHDAIRTASRGHRLTIHDDPLSHAVASTFHGVISNRPIRASHRDRAGRWLSRGSDTRSHYDRRGGCIDHLRSGVGRGAWDKAATVRAAVILLERETSSIRGRTLGERRCRQSKRDRNCRKVNARTCHDSPRLGPQPEPSGAKPHGLTRREPELEMLPLEAVVLVKLEQTDGCRLAMGVDVPSLALSSSESTPDRVQAIVMPETVDSWLTLAESTSSEEFHTALTGESEPITPACRQERRRRTSRARARRSRRRRQSVGDGVAFAFLREPRRRPGGSPSGRRRCCSDTPYRRGAACLPHQEADAIDSEPAVRLETALQRGSEAPGPAPTVRDRSGTGRLSRNGSPQSTNRPEGAMPSAAKWTRGLRGFALS